MVIISSEWWTNTGGLPFMKSSVQCPRRVAGSQQAIQYRHCSNKLESLSGELLCTLTCGVYLYTYVRINWTIYPDLCILLHVSYTSVEPMKCLICPAIVGRQWFIWLLICTSSFDFKCWNKSSQFIRVLCKSEAKNSLMLNHKLDWKPVGQESYLDCPALFSPGC